MSAAGPAVERGRKAFAAADWNAVLEELGPLGNRLEVDDLALLARASWMGSRVPESLELSEEVFHRYESEGRRAEAASTAVLLTFLWVTRGATTLGAGWLSRARRILAELDDSVTHGYLAYVETMVALELGGDPSGSQERLNSLAGRFRDPALQSFDLGVRGLLDLQAGDVEAGFGKLDEAMLPVVAGRVPVEWAGDLYCTVIHACHRIADYRRMADWTRAVEQWCQQFGGESVYTGICRIHRLELRTVHGEWAGLEAQLLVESRAVVDGNPWVAGEGFRQLGEVRRLRGDDAGAREAFASAREVGVDPQPGLALLDLAAGHPDTAWEGLRASLATRRGAGRAELLRAGVDVALSMGKGEAAVALADELREVTGHYGTTVLKCWSLHADGILELEAGHPSQAVELLARAADAFRAERQPHATARALSDLAAAHEALGDQSAAAGCRGESGRILAVLAACDDAAPGPDVGPLTAREAEVLGRVAEGASNREVAGQLFISEKTVGRHLANIYLKLGVGSRTAAAAWWQRHA